MPRKSKKLVEASFNQEPNGQPTVISAHADEIQLHVFFEGEDDSRIVRLRPRHIERIVSMNGDWWESHWKAQRERDSFTG